MFVYVRRVQGLVTGWGAVGWYKVDHLMQELNRETSWNLEQLLGANPRYKLLTVQPLGLAFWYKFVVQSFTWVEGK